MAVKLEIRYCSDCEYLLRAMQLARAIAQGPLSKIPITIKPSEEEGCFQVWLNDRKVFDKEETPHLKAFGSTVDIQRIKDLLAECLKAPV